MTDKQIIIDGVDVSKCNYFNNIDKSYCEECCSEFGCAICNDRPNCYYKQLKRKEQECEKINQALDEIEKIVKQTCSRRCTNDCLGTRKHCGYGQILNLITKAEEE